MANSLDQLVASLKQSSYTALSEKEMKKKAEERYRPVYDQKRQNARESYESGDQALVRQLASLQSSYDQQRAQSDAAYRQSHAQTARSTISRGMQRSSYTGATLSNILLKGAQARQAISGEQAEKERDLEAQRTQAAAQLSRQLAQYDADQKRDELAYLDELEEREFNRSYQHQQAANDLALSIYQAQQEQEKIAYQKQRDAQAQKNWLKEFNAKYGK